MWQRPIVLALAVSLCPSAAACGEPGVEISIDNAFSESRRASVALAAETWGVFGSRGFRIVDRGDWHVIPSPVRSPTGLTWGGLTHQEHQVVRIDTDVPDDEVYEVALHELGHVLGLKHVCRDKDASGFVAVDRPCDPARPFGVMDPSHRTTVFTMDDLVECRRVGQC